MTARGKRTRFFNALGAISRFFVATLLKNDSLGKISRFFVATLLKNDSLGEIPRFFVILNEGAQARVKDLASAIRLGEISRFFATLRMTARGERGNLDISAPGRHILISVGRCNSILPNFVPYTSPEYTHCNRIDKCDSQEKERGNNEKHLCDRSRNDPVREIPGP
jgi:hypothetical protein